jgi:hypothetical protein
MREIVARLKPNPEKFEGKLTPLEVAEIRQKYPRQSLRALGEEYRISQEAVRQVVLNKGHRNPKYAPPVMPRQGRPRGGE